jgi:probable F420-dependent oxidoreductase
VKVRLAVAPSVAAFDDTALAAFAVTAERLGFDTVWLSDVPLSAGGDPLLSLAMIAGQTRSLKLGTNVVPAGRNAMVLARQLAQLDRITAGRLLLSFVPGSDATAERAALGTSGRNRWDGIERDVALLRRWWSGAAIHAPGDPFDGIAVAPTPLQQPLEIWFGGSGPNALQRVGRSADGWLTAALAPDAAGAGRRAIEAHAAACGRSIDPDHFGISLPFTRGRLPAAAAAQLLARAAAHGDPAVADIAPVGAAQLQDVIGRHIDQGLSKFVLRAVGGEDAMETLAWLAGVVLPLQT